VTKNPNAVIVFARTHEVSRSGGEDPFAALPWEDLDSVLHACAADLLHAAASVPDTDVLLCVHPQFPREKLVVPPGNGVRRLEMPRGDFAEYVQQAVEGAFLEYYHRVVVLLENNPLLGGAHIRAAADQLGVEDDCAVITPADGGGVVLAALKVNYPLLFSGKGEGGDARPAGLLGRLCGLDLTVFPTPPSFLLDTTAGFARLRDEVSLRDPAEAGYPRRTGAVFRALERKYRWKRAGR
jgi:hypothetical protein